jgi:transaldolase
MTAITVDHDIHTRPALADAARELALEGFSGATRRAFESTAAFAALKAAGSELWLDTGDLKAASALWCRELVGLTTNNTLVNEVVQTGALDDLARKAARRLRGAAHLSPEALTLEVGFVLNAHVALGLVAAFGAKVSVELHPAVGRDIEGTRLFAQRYYAVEPEHFIIKVPLTPDGLLAVWRLREERVPINLTIGFSARQNYVAALVSRPSYVNVFLGRLNAVIAESGLGDGKYVGEKATIASQRAVSEVRGVHPEVATRQIAASLRGGQQVADLAGVDVLTIPPKAAHEFLDGGFASGKTASQIGREFEVAFAGGRSAAEVGAGVLWEVRPEVRKFAAALLDEDKRAMTGPDVIELARECDVGDLFRAWTPDEEREILKKGKIPDLSRWPGVALDDLMSVSALQSFTADQAKLDERIARLVAEA